MKNTKQIRKESMNNLLIKKNRRAEEIRKAENEMKLRLRLIKHGYLRPKFN